MRTQCINAMSLKLVRCYFLLAILPSCIHLSSPFRLKDAYDLFVPIIHWSSEGYGELVIKISNFILHLEKQELPPYFTNIYFNKAGRVVETNISNCFYSGIVEDHRDWDVAVTLCKGLQGHFGITGDKKHYYHFKPLAQDNDSIHQLHILHYGSSSPIQNITSHNSLCDISSEQIKHLRFEGMREEKTHQASRRQQRIVEIALVNDYSQYLSYNKELSSVILRNIEIVNYINQLYTGFNVSLALVGTVTWTIENQIPIPADNNPVAILEGFRNYYHLIPLETDSAMLISGNNFEGNIVGLAYKGAMCFGSYSVAIVQDGRGGVEFVGGTAAHEIGHVLGMSHDNFEGRTCDCDDPTGKCIMADVSTSIPPTVWSNCSFQDMENNFIAYPATQACLFNDPPTRDALSITQGRSSSDFIKNITVFVTSAVFIGLSTFM